MAKGGSLAKTGQNVARFVSHTPMWTLLKEKLGIAQTNPKVEYETMCCCIPLRTAVFLNALFTVLFSLSMLLFRSYVEDQVRQFTGGYSRVTCVIIRVIELTGLCWGTMGVIGVIYLKSSYIKIFFGYQLARLAAVAIMYYIDIPLLWTCEEWRADLHGSIKKYGFNDIIYTVAMSNECVHERRNFYLFSGVFSLLMIYAAQINYRFQAQAEDEPKYLLRIPKDYPDGAFYTVSSGSLRDKNHIKKMAMLGHSGHDTGHWVPRKHSKPDHFSGGASHMSSPSGGQYGSVGQGHGGVAPPPGYLQMLAHRDLMSKPMSPAMHQAFTGKSPAPPAHRMGTTDPLGQALDGTPVPPQMGQHLPHDMHLQLLGYGLQTPQHLADTPAAHGITHGHPGHLPPGMHPLPHHMQGMYPNGPMHGDVAMQTPFGGLMNGPNGPMLLPPSIRINAYKGMPMMPPMGPHGANEDLIPPPDHTIHDEDAPAKPPKPQHTLPGLQSAPPGFLPPSNPSMQLPTPPASMPANPMATLPANPSAQSHHPA